MSEPVPYLSIIVPAYNEMRRLTSSVEEVIKAVDRCGLTCEIIIVDDASRDGTFAVAEELASMDKRISVIRNIQNLGLGGAYKAGLSIAKGKYVTWVPGDASHPAAGLLSAYRAIGMADIIIPRPINPQARGLVRRLISTCYTKLINGITGYPIPYYNGLSVHRTELLRSLNLKTNSFGFQAEAIVKLLLQGATYQIVDTEITERQVGRSKAFGVKNVLAVLATLAHIAKIALLRRHGTTEP